MATQGKLENDAKRMGSRGFGGYLADRALGRYDFRPDSGAEKEASAGGPLGVNKTRRQGVTEDAYAKGGAVKKLTMKAYEDSSLDKDPPGTKEGSPADLRRDRAAIAAENRKRGFASGGMVGYSKTNIPDGPAKSRRGYGKARGA